MGDYINDGQGLSKHSDAVPSVRQTNEACPHDLAVAER